MSITRMPIRDAFIAFVECEVRGFWQPIDRLAALPQEQGAFGFTSEQQALSKEIGWSTYKSIREGSEIAIVRPDGLVRRFSFKNQAVIAIGQMMVRFYQEDVMEEISVDEDARSGKSSRPKVVGEDK